MSNKISQIYKKIESEKFPEKMEIIFHYKEEKKSLLYEKAMWNLDGVEQGLRYGENPGQPAALYKLVNGNLELSGCETILPGQYLVSDAELLQSGKHPGKTNITDIDNSLNILKFFNDKPCSVIVKHNNPCGVAKGSTLLESYQKALLADRVAAFGGAVACNRAVDKELALFMSETYIEVIAAPEFEEGVLEIFGKKKNLRVIKIGAIEKLDMFVGKQYVDFKSLIDGGIICQYSFSPATLNIDDLIQPSAEKNGEKIVCSRQPDERELEDMMFGWLVETGITSNSVIYVKDGVTIGVGTGEQDRVGVAEIARDKAYKKAADRLSWKIYKKGFADITEVKIQQEIMEEVRRIKGDLIGAVMVSDAFFPFRDGIEVGLREGVSAVIQPGGAMRDADSIQACNEYNAAMMFTGQRCFKH